MNVSDTSNPNLEKQLGEFIALSGEFLKLVGYAGKMETESFFRLLYNLLPMLYVSGLALPDTDNPDDGGSMRFVTEEEWESVFNSIREKTGTEDELLLYDNELSDPEILKGSVAELIADIYQDLQDFAVLLSKGTTSATRNAVFEVKQLFYSHWGQRLLFIQQYLHRRYHRMNIDDGYDLD